MKQLRVSEETFAHSSHETGMRVWLLTAGNFCARVSNFGARLISMECPDREGNIADITLGYDDVSGWMGDPFYIGATIGRVGNRIADGAFSLHGKTFDLAKNNAPAGIPCHLHGGNKGFDQYIWDAEIIEGEGVVFSRVSEDGEENYAGKLTVTVTYRLTAEGVLTWVAEAESDQVSVVNMVQHAYWNLSGKNGSTILEHEMLISADSFLPTSAGMIPNGEIASVIGTAMDFRTFHSVASRIDDDFEPLRIGTGYDHCWVLNAENQVDGLHLAATVREPNSGRVMSVFTNQPGVQCYTGNFLNSDVLGKNKVPFSRRGGLCLETQAFPDAVNHPNFPSIVLNAGDRYVHVMECRFSTMESTIEKMK